MKEKGKGRERERERASICNHVNKIVLPITLLHSQMKYLQTRFEDILLVRTGKAALFEDRPSLIANGLDRKKGP